MARLIPTIIGACLLMAAIPAEAQTLRGSRAKMQAQNSIARQHDYSFLRTASDVRRFADLGLLVPVRGNADYALASVSFAYARPAVRTFVERLGSQYRRACGEKLVITSLTRPSANQPRNASPLSVHPAGMAVDLRVPRNATCRRWLENTLLQLDRQGLVSAIRENNPPHYHVAVYPTPYLRYVQRLGNDRAGVRLAEREPEPNAQRSTVAVATASVVPGKTSSEATLVYRVNRGDTLWSIARRHNTTVDTLKELNRLASARIVAGQTLSIPAP
jgi:LysM repeat protein